MTCTASETDVETRIRELFAEHGGPLTRFVKALTAGNRQNAEDLVQETMIRAWHNLDALPPGSDGRSRRWLFTVARRLVIDEVRRSQARPCEVAAEANPKLGATGDETSGIAVANQALRQAVDDLSAAHRQVLHEIFFRNRTVDEVAADLGIPVGTVRSRVHYAQRALRVAVIEG
ncbi:sigma-70 family RNA polymerase sigma factor [Paractinoplanes hotanensis]|uniref:Sigma-70 family RNA polymerase sigma factor n=1 Tax=Paractinoplanes hotanensis TaxID=2906497 RepID=A0ABT0YBN0_9ACTN|nr:sigma-70 family RNA polymerase sigma factor [Actinoplanes hotanensis]MCM4083443.1 sigma-70 family RNA polymerase sigma factor [Actinoplanes hotanensis]